MSWKEINQYKIVSVENRRFASSHSDNEDYIALE
jgi:hypothetical protein